jgi:hypothetical protein
MSKPPIPVGHVNDPDHDKPVSDAGRFVHDRRVEALAMIDLWTRSTKPYAAAELCYWQGVLQEKDCRMFGVDEER